ncbi:MAG: EAL domain-containing protein [Xanthobacteraceae bacterium]
MDDTASQLSAKDARPARYLVAVVVAIIGALFSVVAFVAVSNSEHRLAAVKLQELAKNDQQTLNSDLEYATEVLYTLRAYYSTADQTVGRSEFQAFAKDLRGRLVGLRNTGWARRVTREERDAFERSVRAEGFPNFEIWERDSQGNRVRAADRAEYLPILYPDPVEYTAQILGFDISSEPIRAAALRRARSSERPSATPPMNLITKTEPDGFMTFIPVYPKGSIKQETSRAPEGFMYGVFGTAPMIENILGAKAIPSGLDIYFFNPNGAPGNRRIYWHPSRSRPAQSPVPSEETLLAGAHWAGSIRVADQEWGAIFVPSGQLIADAGSWRPGAALATGLAMTALIVAYLLVSLKRTLRLEFLTTSLHEATDELRREGEKVKQLARTDSMTGLANRATFSEHLNYAFAAAKRDGKHFAVIYLDLDHFKDVNDTLGHPCGDRLLQIAAERLRAVVRENDLIARLGGDEFAICVTGAADLAAVGQLASRIKNTLAEKFDLDGNEVHVSASLGISMFNTNAVSPDAMMMQADVALYQAKNEGRNDFRFHSIELDREIHERVAVTEELHAAFANNELELYYQPQVEVPSGRIVGLEALLRWNHPKRGLTLPGSFIPIAEQTGTIHALGRWVLEETCRQIKNWQAEGISPPIIAINISAAQFKGPTTPDQDLRETLARYAVDPKCIEIELTESVLVETTEANNEVVRRVRELGVSIAIDDFGTGYSSLAYLRSYRVNRLKIAQQFMPKLGIESGAAAIVRATIMLARELGMEVIAEGVETAEQVAFLLNSGCRFVQGYYFGRPVPMAEATALLRAGVITREPARNSAENLRRVTG